MAENAKGLTKIKGDTPLDYAEFQISQCQTRCRLHISAKGIIKKVASGSLKPFSTHLQTLEEQVGKGGLSVRLECNPSSIKKNGRSWFTKGTMERFVRFVSSPEILVQVKTIEDEISQLQLMRRSQPRSISKFGDQPLHGNGAIDTIDRKSVATCQEQNGSLIQSRKYQLDVGDNAGETSKKEVLKAMDGHLLVLKQEQEMAFSRAAAAGFKRENIDDLIAFAENFGANRLREACMDFINLLRKRDKAYSESKERRSLTGEASSTTSDISIASGTKIKLIEASEVTSHVETRNSCNFSSNVHMRKHDCYSASASHKPIQMNSQDTIFSIGESHWGDTDGRRPDRSTAEITAGMNVNSVCETLSNDQAVRESTQNETRWKEWHGFSLNSKAKSDIGYGQAHFGLEKTSQEIGSPSKDNSFFTQLEQMLQKIEARSVKGMKESLPSISAPSEKKQDKIKHKKDRTYSWHAPEGFSGSNGLSSMLTRENCTTLPSDEDGQLSGVNKGVCEGSSSSKMCHMPLQQAEIASFGTQQVALQRNTNNFCFQEQFNGDGIDKEAPKNIKSNRKDYSKINGCRNDDTHAISFSASVRNLSVQDAINLFESRKRGTSDGCGKKLSSQYSCATGNSSIPKAAVLRRWSGAHEFSSELSIQQNVCASSDKQLLTMDAKPNREQHFSEENTITSRDVKDASKSAPSLYQEGLRDSSSSSTSSVDKNIHPQLLHNVNPDLCLPSEASDRQLSLERYHSPKLDTQSFSGNSDRQLCLKQEQSPGSEAGHFSNTCSREVPTEKKNPMVGDSPNMPENDWRKQFKLELERRLASDFKPKIAAPAISLSKHVDRNSEKARLLKESATNLLENNLTKISMLSSHESGITCELGNCSENIFQSVQDNSPSIVVINECSELRPQIETQCSPSGELLKESALLVQEDVKGRDKMSQVEPKQSIPKVHSESKLDNKGRLCSSTSDSSSATPKNENNLGGEIKNYSTMSDVSPITIKIENNFKGEDKSTFGTTNGYNTFGMIENECRGDTKDNSSNTEDKVGREFLGTSWTDASMEFHFKALLSIVSHQYPNLPCLEDDGSATTHRGKLYGYYSQLRNARLREARSYKRAETDARMKAIGEILDRRKTEMEGRIARIATMQSRTEKPEAESVATRKKERDEEKETDPEEYLVLAHDQINSNPSSSVLMPHAIDQVSTSTPCSLMKHALISQGCAAMAHDLKCRTTSQSPRSVLKYPMGNSLGQRKSAAPSNRAGITGNSQVQNNFNVTDYRKEDSAGCTSGCQVLSKKNDTINGSRFLLAEGKLDEKLTSHKVQNEGTPEVLANKFGHSVVTSIKEPMPFLQRGHAIGQGAGPSIMMPKVKTITEDVEKPHKCRPSSSAFNTNDLLKGNVRPGTVCSEKNMRIETCMLTDTSVTENLASQLSRDQHKQPEKPEFDDQKIIESNQIKASSYSSSFLSHEYVVPSFSPGASSPMDSSLIQSCTASGHVSPPSLLALDSPVRSPPLNHGEIQHVSGPNVVRTRKTWAKPQNPIMIAIQHPSKETGLKKLLKFGRTSRACETIMTDCTSASTSDGDEDLDDSRNTESISSNDNLRQARMQEKIVEFKNITGSADSYTGQSRGTSSRPIFSLSSCRTKVGDGKSR